MVKVYEKGSQFSPNELVMIALLAGGDYDVSHLRVIIEFIITHII